MNPLSKQFSLDSKGLCVAWHDPRIDGLNGPRPTLRVGALYLNPRPLRALAPAASFRGPLCFASLSAKKYGTPYFSARNRTYNVADAEHVLSTLLNSAEAIYRANFDMKGFHQEVVRVVLLDAQHRCITRVDIARGTVNESFAAPREIFRPAIIHSAFAFVLVQNHPSGAAKPSSRSADHQARRGCCSDSSKQFSRSRHRRPGYGRRPGFFSFQEAGLL
jgi:hypothetical protein